MQVTRSVFALLLLLAGSALAKDYHVDSTAGNDSAPGTSPSQAWKTLDKVNATEFTAGDRLLFKAGGRWSGQLHPKGSGRANGQKVEAITITRYGEGPLPRIDGEGKVSDTVLLENIQFWEVTDLEITNQGPKTAPWRTGVRILADGIGTMQYIALRRLYVHDVNGDLRKSHEGCGIFFEAKGRDISFDRLLIENCKLDRTDRNGICQRSPRQKVPVLLFTDWDKGFAEGATFTNNLVLVSEGGKALYKFGPDKGTTFEGNVFAGVHEGLPAGTTISKTVPKLKGPLEPADGLASAERFKPAATDRNFPCGTAIKDNGGRDFFGMPLPTDRPAIGAAEP